jgi:hypothetical protein
MRDAHTGALITIDTTADLTALRCDVCGTERGPTDPILCRVCGEPVLGEEWTP